MCLLSFRAISACSLSCLLLVQAFAHCSGYVQHSGRQRSHTAAHNMQTYNKITQQYVSVLLWQYEVCLIGSHSISVTQTHARTHTLLPVALASV
jgi:hypothetical protein